MGGYALVLLVGLAAGALSGVIGTGSTIMLMPLLVLQFGPKEAVPIMAIAGLMSNVAKVAAWWREIDWPACTAFALPGIPAATLGARTLLALDGHVVDIALGVFFLAMIPTRHWLDARKIRLSLWGLALAGAVIGYLTGIVISTGPLSVPAFTSYGLLKGAFISTEAASSLAIFVSKVTTFRALGALPGPAILEGLIIGTSVMIGAFIGKAIVQRMTVEMYRYILDVLLFVSGMTLLWAAI